jgi:hypothetical protein
MHSTFRERLTLTFGVSMAFGGAAHNEAKQFFRKRRTSMDYFEKENYYQQS